MVAPKRVRWLPGLWVVRELLGARGIGGRFSHHGALTPTLFYSLLESAEGPCRVRFLSSELKVLKVRGVLKSAARSETQQQRTQQSRQSSCAMFCPILKDHFDSSIRTFFACGAHQGVVRGLEAAWYKITGEWLCCASCYSGLTRLLVIVWLGRCCSVATLLGTGSTL